MGRAKVQRDAEEMARIRDADECRRRRNDGDFDDDDEEDEKLLENLNKFVTTKSLRLQRVTRLIEVSQKRRAMKIKRRIQVRGNGDQINTFFLFARRRLQRPATALKVSMAPWLALRIEQFQTG